MSDDNGRVSVAALTGRARFSAGGKSLSVPAGSESSSVAGGPPSDPERIPEEVLLDVVWPAEEQRHATDRASVEGHAHASTRVTINGTAASVGPDGRFNAVVPLRVGKNTLDVAAEDVIGRTRHATGTVVRRGPPPSADARAGRPLEEGTVTDTDDQTIPGPRRGAATPARAAGRGGPAGGVRTVRRPADSRAAAAAVRDQGAGPAAAGEGPRRAGRGPGLRPPHRRAVRTAGRPRVEPPPALRPDSARHARPRRDWRRAGARDLAAGFSAAEDGRDPAHAHRARHPARRRDAGCHRADPDQSAGQRAGRRERFDAPAGAAARARAGREPAVRGRSRSRTTARESRRRCARVCSSRSSRPRGTSKGRAWDWRSAASWPVAPAAT